MKKSTLIFDIDGVLADSSHRQRHDANGRLDLNHWRENSTAEQIRKDRPLPLVEYARGMMQTGVNIAVCTSRVIGPADLIWLCEHIGHDFDLMSRDGETDNRRDGELKSTKLAEYLNRNNLNPSECQFFDDLKENVEAARALGIQSEHITGQDGGFKMVAE